jgi:GMP synthase-like glutamine amidotransferase
VQLRNLLVFQHIDCEHPGIFRYMLNKAGVQWDVVSLDAGDSVPALEGYDALWVMGGPMDVWDEQDCPWLVMEKAAIRRWVLELNKPYLGFCLGHQLLADALDGHCARQDQPEIGILDVGLTPAGQTDPLFEGIDPTIKCLQWHSVQVKSPPTGAVVLASSEVCQCQAMRVGQNAYGIQFHVELQESTISDWGQVPAYAEALDNTLGPGSLARMQGQASPLFPEFRKVSEILFRNFVEKIV